MPIAGDITAVPPFEAEIWMAWRGVRTVDMCETDAIESGHDKGRAWPAADTGQRLIHCPCLISKNRYRRARITDHRFEKQHPVTHIVQPAKSDHGAVEMVQKAEAVHYVKST